MAATILGDALRVGLIYYGDKGATADELTAYANTHCTTFWGMPPGMYKRHQIMDVLPYIRNNARFFGFSVNYTTTYFGADRRYWYVGPGVELSKDTIKEILSKLETKLRYQRTGSINLAELTAMILAVPNLVDLENQCNIDIQDLFEDMKTQFERSGHDIGRAANFVVRLLRRIP